MCWKGMEKISWTDHVTMNKYCVESRGKEYPTQNKKKEG